MNKSKLVSSLVVFAVLACAANSFALTINFDTLSGGPFNVGDIFYASSVPITVQDVAGGTAFVSNSNFAAGSGKEIGIQNVMLNFGFSLPLDGLSMQFGEGVGNTDTRIMVNGQTIVGGAGFAGLAGPIAGTNVTLFVIPTGVNTGALFFMGDITSFAIGGENIYIDNVIASEIPEPATLALLGLGGGLAFIRKKRAA